MAARIDIRLAQSGRAIGTLDTMIAAICLTTKLSLVTRNTKHFTHIPGLTVDAW
jgi:predicted nucleic acid-binding protein